MQTPLVLKGTTSSGQQIEMQPGMVTVPMSVSSSMPSSMANVVTLNKPGQTVVTTQNLGSGQPTIIPNVQILNMRPGTPNVAAPKSVATVSPRVVIGAPQVMGARAAAPGAIALQTLQSLQPGQQGHLLLKTENGQYQLLRVGPAPASSLAAPQAHPIRLSTVPAGGGVATLTTSVAGPGQLSSHQLQGSPGPGPASAPAPAPPLAPVVTAPPAAAPTQPTPQQQKGSDNTKEKCRNFLANLLDLSSKEPASVERSVRTLIQELIDGQVQPETFCDRLERLLNASPQPCLIGFLKKSLPLLRQSLVTGELSIEGISPPQPHVAFGGAPPAPQTVPQPAPQPAAQPALHLKASGRPGGIAVLQNIPVQSKINVGKGKPLPVTSKGFPKAASGQAALSTVLTPGKSLLKEERRKTGGAYTMFADDKMAGDDDINDVAAMGGVNLAEESQRILHTTELIGTQIRSTKDEYVVGVFGLQSRVRGACAGRGLEEPAGEVAALLSHAAHERLRTLVEKLAVIAQHRIDPHVKTDPRHEVTQDVKGQLKFLEELDRVDKKRREESEREMLLRAAKSRSKTEDPEQAKLKAKAKEMQRAELEELRQREANLTALQAIGPRKRPRTDQPANTPTNQQPNAVSGRSQTALRSRLKRINLRDMLFLLEQERDSAHSTQLYRAYLK